MTNRLTITFWGVRGSHPVPGPTTLRYGGNTPCIEVRTGDQVLILDAGTGIIGLGRELARHAAESGQPITATILLSHMHGDHTEGLPFFVPAYLGSSKLHIFGPEIVEDSLDDVLKVGMQPPVFPVTLREMPATKIMQAMCETDVLLLGEAIGGVTVRNRYHEPVEDDEALLRVRALRSYAHPGGTFIYRIEWCGRSLVYATDVEGYAYGDRRLIDFARGADLLIHDSQYSEEHYLGRRRGAPTTQGWGHSTPQMACDIAEAAGVSQLVLFHHDPQNDDQMITQMEIQAQQRRPEALAAYEGMQLIFETVTTEQITTGMQAVEKQPKVEGPDVLAA